MATHITSAELQTYREFLCLTAGELGEMIGMTSENVIRYENREGLGGPQAKAVMRLVTETYDVINMMASTLDRKHPHGRMATVYRTDAEYRAAFPGSPWTAAWHRMVTAHAAVKASGVRGNRTTQIVYGVA